MPLWCLYCVIGAAKTNPELFTVSMEEFFHLPEMKHQNVFIGMLKNQRPHVIPVHEFVGALRNLLGRECDYHNSLQFSLLDDRVVEIPVNGYFFRQMDPESKLDVCREIARRGVNGKSQPQWFIDNFVLDPSKNKTFVKKKRAQIMDHYGIVPVPCARVKHHLNNEIYCPSCYTDFTPEMMVFQAQCKHVVCVECIIQYVSDNISFTPDLTLKCFICQTEIKKYNPN